MRFERLLAGAAAAALMAGSALAQSGGSMSGSMQPNSPNGAGSMQSPAGAAQPYAPPPTTGGMAQPSDTGGNMTGDATSGGSMGAMSGASFTPIRPMPASNIIATLTASGEFTKLLAALKDTNLTDLIATHPNLTLFAPTDAAFAALPPGQLDMLMKSPPQLQAILTYHLVAATIKPTDVMGHAAGKVPTAAKKSITLDGSGPTLKADTASVLQPGVTASNGIIYPIDKVLTPPAV
ncbi:fasciclin domain-containing protein [Caulobacter sp. S45]|uniref:fasciclin domain-containing protein n=1 Tax=Caulobacter sp. S45 TaxID=1641861 RepID=UPI001575799B|nr:fasciclin domain-containing protein [Caulobacter sp. S45]